MKYEVKMSCGHTETIQLFGKIADRERRIGCVNNFSQIQKCHR